MLFSVHGKLFLGLCFPNNYIVLYICSLQHIYACLHVHFRKSIAAEESIVEESPVKPAEGVVLIEACVFFM